MQFEILYQELVHSVEMVRQLVIDISRTEARSRPDPESWSVLEVICHLYDEEREDFRQRLDIILHRPEEKWPPIDPVGWVTMRKYNERDLTEVRDQWIAERNCSLTWLRGLSTSNWDVEYPAPFGPIRAGDMLAAWVAHDNMHIRQLVELRRVRVVQITQPYEIRYAGEW